MNVRSLSLCNIIVILIITIMNTSIVFKIFIVLPLIIFVDYVVMVIIGCSSCLFGLGDDFYCGPYCIIGKIILGFSALFFGYLLYPDIAQLFKSLKNAKAKEK